MESEKESYGFSEYEEDEDEDVGYHSGGTVGRYEETEDELQPQAKSTAKNSAPSNVNVNNNNNNNAIPRLRSSSQVSSPRPAESDAGSIRSATSQRSLPRRQSLPNVRASSANRGTESDHEELDEMEQSISGFGQDDEEYVKAEQAYFSGKPPTSRRHSISSSVQSTPETPQVNSPNLSSYYYPYSSPQTPISLFDLASTMMRQTDQSYLRDYGPVPKGFRPSTLSALLEHGAGHLSRTFIPRLNPSGMLYEDLLIDHQSKAKSLRRHICINSFKVTIGDTKGISIPGGGTVPLSRRLRICLFDDKNAVSNVHTIHAKWTKDDPKTWIFPSRYGVFRPRSGENSFLVRTAETSFSLYLLFELCVVFKRIYGVTPGGPETGELSCGWCKLPLFPQGQFLEMRNYEFPLKGGTPFDENIPIDTTDQTPNTPSKGIFARFASKVLAPLITIKVSKLSTNELRSSSYLPRTILTSFSSMPLLHLYREILLDCLVKQHHHTLHAGISHYPPALRIFVDILDTHDHMELLIALWSQQFSKFKRSDLSNPEFLKQQFLSTIYRAWPFMHMFESLRAPHQLLTEREINARFNAAQQFINQPPETHLVKNQSQILYQPFNVQELVYSPLMHIDHPADF